MYVEELDEDYVGYNNHTIKTILIHIKDNWCIITTLEKRQAAENFCVQWDETTHITKYARLLDKQQRLCRDIGVPAPDLTKVQYYVENMYSSEMFDEKEMNAWENKPTTHKDWKDAKAYFKELYRGKRKYMEEHKACTGGFESANSIGSFQRNSSISSYQTSNSANGPPNAIVSTTDQQAFADYTNDLEGALEDAGEQIAAITSDRDLTLENIKAQQTLMMEQQEKFLAMMLNAGIGQSKPDKTEGDTARKGCRGTAPRKCEVCGKSGVRHLDIDCWEDDSNADKLPKWHPKHKDKA
jgi:hypothetical protein